MSQWWEKDSQNLTYAVYQVTPETQVLVGNRPNFNGTTAEFVNEVEGWINVTDRLVRYPSHVRSFWFPWNEAGYPSVEAIYGVLKTLHYWVDELKLKKIYIHCDGGTHRAVSMFGFYLIAYHSSRQVEINNSRVLVNREHWSNPLEYAASYLSEMPDIEAIIKSLPLSDDDTQYGHSLEDYLRENVGEAKLAQYRWIRYKRVTLKMALINFKYDFKRFISYTLFKGPYIRANYWVHKKMNTKKGKYLKKNGF
jgi:protein-tyrosine phosphatase